MHVIYLTTEQVEVIQDALEGRLDAWMSCGALDDEETREEAIAKDLFDTLFGPIIKEQ